MKKYIVTCCHNMTGKGPEVFLRSLEQQSVDCQVVLIGDSQNYNTTLPLTRLPLRVIQGNPIMDRFHSMQFLNFENDDQVLITDIRDIVFQSDPFQCQEVFGKENRLKVHVFAENHLSFLDQDDHNRQWMEAIKAPPEKYMGRVIVCAGAIAGRWIALRGYLTRLSMTIRQFPPFFGLDQACHNLFVYSDPWGFKVHSNESGPVEHLVLVKSPTYNKIGIVTNQTGTEPAIVHQYDRHPELARLIEKRIL